MQRSDLTDQSTTNPPLRVSNHYASFISPPESIKSLIENNFKIPLVTLNNFIEYVRSIDPVITIDFKEIYQHLESLYNLNMSPIHHHNRRRLHPEHFYRAPEHHLALLTCCLNTENQTTLLEQIIPYDEYFIWLAISIFAHANHTVRFLMKLYKGWNHTDQFAQWAKQAGNIDIMESFHNNDLESKKLILTTAADTGNVSAVTELIPAPDKHLFPKLVHKIPGYNLLEHQFKLKPTQYTLECAVFSGKTDIFHYLMNPENQFHLQPTQRILDVSALSGNIHMLIAVLTISKQHHIKPTQETLDNAAYSGNLEVVLFLLNPEQSFGLQPTESTVKAAVLSGSLDIFRHLFNPENHYHLQPNMDTLNEAAQAGQYEIACFLTDPVNGYGLVPNYDTLGRSTVLGDLRLFQHIFHCLGDNHKYLTPHLLHGVALSGNLTMLTHILHITAETTKIQPDFTTLENAILADNPDMVRFLLDPANHFEFISLLGSTNLITTYPSRIIHQQLVDATTMMVSLLSHLAFVEENDLEEKASISNDIKMTAEISLCQCFAYAIDAILNRERYQLENHHIDYLINNITSIIEKSINSNELSCTQIERQTIVNLLNRSGDDRLMTLANLLDKTTEIETPKVSARAP